MSSSEIQKFREDYRSHLSSQLNAVSSYKPTADMLGGKWTGLVWPGNFSQESSIVRDPDTGVDVQTLKRLGQQSVEVPAGFVRH